MITKKNSLLFKTLSNIIFFSVFILLFLWLIQVVFYNLFYEKYTIRRLDNIKKTIEKAKDEELATILENIAYEDNICIEVTDGYASVGYNLRTKACALGKNYDFITKIKRDVYSGAYGRYIINNKELANKSLLYGIKKNNNFIFIYSSLEDVNTTSNVLRSQLIYITIIVIIFAIGIAYFISKRITKPILKMTNSAKKLGEGDYRVVFEKTGITEMDDLANTLNAATSELNKKNEIRNDLVANVSHDFKTPLTMIKAYAEMVKDFSYKDTKKRNENIDVIIKETDRLNTLVNDILDLKKLEQSKEILNIEKYDIINEIKEIINKFNYLKKDGYFISYEGPDKLLIEADKSKLNQVVYNLINNALNYTGKDKKVVVKVTKNKNDSLIEIVDTGKGIDTEELKYIWEKYYRSGKKHQRNEIGTGLGLSIVKEILVRHNFNYGVQSTKGKGSTFYFNIKNVK